MSRTPKVVVQQIIPHAGLGNCMFEIAGGLAVARRLGLPCTYHWTPSHKRPWGLRMFGLPPNMVPKRQPVLRQMRRRDAGMVDEACRRVPSTCGLSATTGRCTA